MKKGHVVWIVAGLFLAFVANLAILVVPRKLDAGAGIIAFPFYRGPKTMDAARDMIFDLGWKHESEGGNARGVTFRARDSNGKMVKMLFVYRVIGTRVQVSTESGAQYSAPEVTRELARRIGMAVEGEALPEVTGKTPTTP